jgi:hypothetical protein
MSTQHQRKRLWVDPPFQSRLLLRTLLYLVGYVVILWHLSFFIELLVALATDGLREGVGALYLTVLWKQRALLMALAVTAPMFMYDLLKFSHRIAGPLYRCRNLMQEMADGQRVPEFKPRENDFMRELFAAFNALIKTWNSRGVVTPVTVNGAGKPPAADPAPESQPVST